MRNFHAMCAAIAVVCVPTTTLAQSQPAPSLRTEVLTALPPPGWVLSNWQGGTLEFGEFTPPGQTQGRYVDVLGYSVLPRMPGGPSTIADVWNLETASVAKTCKTPWRIETPIDNGWLGLTRICMGRNPASPEQVELEYAVTTMTEQAIYRVWRAWRGTTDDLSQKANVDIGSSLDESEFAEIAAALRPSMSADLQRREVCDLSRPEKCSSFAAPVPEPFKTALNDTGGYIAAVYAEGLNTISRQQFLASFGSTDDDGSPNRVIAALTVDDIDWNDPQAINKLLYTVALGQAADGALLSIADPDNHLSESARTVVRANLVAAARRLQKPDRPSSILTISLPPSSSQPMGSQP